MISVKESLPEMYVPIEVEHIINLKKYKARYMGEGVFELESKNGSIIVPMCHIINWKLWKKQPS